MTEYEKTCADGDDPISDAAVKRNGGSRRDDGAKRLLRAMTGVSDFYIEEAAQFGNIRQIAGSGEREQPAEKLKREQQSAERNREENGKSETAGTAGTGNIRRIRRWTTAVIAAAACFAAIMVGVRVGRISSGSTSGTAEGTAASGTSSETAKSGAAAETAEDAADSLYDEAVSPYEEVKSMSEAEAMTGFGMDLPEAEEPYAKTVINVVDQTMIEVDYYNNDETELGYSIRKAEGSEDISGDYSDYAETETKDVNGITVTMKGESGTWSVAVWTSDGYSYAVSAPDHPLTKAQILAIVQATG